MRDSGTITRQLRLVSRRVAASTRDPELALANMLQWTPNPKAGPRRIGPGKTEMDTRKDRKSASWKVAIALRLKETTQAGNRWMAEHLNIGRAEAVSVYVGRLRTRNPTESGDYLQLTTIVST